MARSVPMMRMLLDAGANPRAVTELGCTAFHAAIDVSGEANDEASVRSTLRLLKELGLDLEQADHQGQTPFMKASTRDGARAQSTAGAGRTASVTEGLTFVDIDSGVKPVAAAVTAAREEPRQCKEDDDDHPHHGANARLLSWKRFVLCVAAHALRERADALTLRAQPALADAASIDCVGLVVRAGFGHRMAIALQFSVGTTDTVYPNGRGRTLSTSVIAVCPSPTSSSTTR